MAEEALRDKRAHDWGYRYTWPPTLGNLSPRERGKIELAAQAEAYLKHEHRPQRQASLSHREYDVESSRREWSKSFQ